MPVCCPLPERYRRARGEEMVSLTVMVANFLATAGPVTLCEDEAVLKCIEWIEPQLSGTARIWAEQKRPPVFVLAVCF